MAASAPGSSTLELRGVCKRYGTGQGGQVTAQLKRAAAGGDRKSTRLNSSH